MRKAGPGESVFALCMPILMIGKATAVVMALFKLVTSLSHVALAVIDQASPSIARQAEVMNIETDSIRTSVQFDRKGSRRRGSQ